MNIFINFLRLSYGSFLIFSGFLKIVDPLGFSYKLQEYFEVFGMDWLAPLALTIAFCVCLFEVFLGIFLLLGMFISKVMWGNLILMVFFTFLTFYSAYFNAVTDCGCFGDFMKLEPWDSFYKDILLLIVSFLLFFNQIRIKPFMSDNFNVIVLLLSLITFTTIPFYGLLHLPILDFRAYKVGSNIIESRKLPDNAKQDLYEEVWYYELDGNVREFSTEEKPWTIDGATFRDRKSILISKGDEPLIKDFNIIDEYNDIDLTDSILNMKSVYLLISYDINKTKLKGHQKADKLLQSGIPIYGLSSSSNEDILSALDLTELKFPYFSVDQTTLKTIVRSNPGLVLIKNGVVVDKWHWRDIPKK